MMSDALRKMTPVTMADLNEALDDGLALDKYMGPGQPRRVEPHGDDILEFIAQHFDLQPLSDEGWEAIKRARQARAQP
jgi:hypothetical protein